MAEYRLARRVSEVADRLDRFQSLNSRSVLWLLGATLALLLLVANHWSLIPQIPVFVTAGIALLLVLAGWRVSRRPERSLHDAAIAIEQRWPELDSRLVTAIDQRPEQGAGGFSFLQHEVITETLLHSHRNDWMTVISPARMARARFRHVVCQILCIAAFAAAIHAGLTRDSGTSNLVDSDTVAAGTPYQVTIDPGNAEIERGTGLIVTARFDGRIPGDVTLHTVDTTGQETAQPLSKSLDDPLFGCHLARIDTDLSYHITFDRQDSDTYHITVFDFPELERADATVSPPEYAGLEEKTIEDVRRLSMLEGSRLTLTCRLNKPVHQAVLRGDEQLIELSPGDGEQNALLWSTTLIPQKKMTLRLELLDREGRANQEPPEFVIDLIPNLPPDLAIEFPGKDIRISPLQEMSIEANATDDFGLQEVGLIYQLPGAEEQTLKLGDGNQSDAAVKVAHELAMEDIAAQPNELVAYYLYADDVGPDGQTRRTFSDLYFAEVRHFDEEYREAQSPQGQGAQQGGTPADKLLELQRDIVNAIWKLIRRETADEPTADFPADSQTITDSQSQALDLAHEMTASLEDALSRQHGADAVEQMTSALESLQVAADSLTAEPLPKARTFAYNAYQALLKLQAREHLSRSQSNSSSQSQSSRQDLDQQLQNLELKNDRNRYENEQQEQPSADREQLQVLNRLRELARRQSGLNEKIQELENALRAAENEEERREIERQLKRLQEEQQELLRDLDELQERMNSEQNRRQMADAREQAQNVRENLRRTSEALKEGQMSRALASGTRAERELERMKDELREQTAGQFTDAMRELREQTRELAQQQQQLGDALSEQPQPEPAGPPQLKDTSDNDLEEQLTDQREALSQLMNELKKIVEQSELNEPLLSKTLYEAIRKTRADQPEESLEMTRRFLRYSMTREARHAEEQARQGIENLRDGVEKAAESVLGNEVDSLRRAQAELDKLTQAIGEELAQSTDETEVNQQAASSGETSPSESEASSNPLDSSQSTERHSGGEEPTVTQQATASSETSPSNQKPAGESRSNPLSSFLTEPNEDQQGGATGAVGPHRPLTGADFVQWSDGMRDVEEMVSDPDLRSQIAQIRDRARQMRIDVKRHSQSPNWDLVNTNIYGPMLELRTLLAEEIARRDSSDGIVPIDRDPVPERYSELVERYYERLGSGR
ncbi:MAG: DUF4175 family protein [Planctomycetaceae bacterium]